MSVRRVMAPLLSAQSGTADRPLAAVFAAALVFTPLLSSSPALASCDQVGSNVSCTGTTTNYDAGTQTNLTITVQPGATVTGVAPTDAMRVQNSSGVTGNALINNGTIDGFVTILSVNPTDTFTNNGVLKITDPNSPLQQHSMAGSLFTQNASGTFYARVDQNGFNDGIFARNASLSGGFVAVVQAGLYPAAITYTGIVSTFAGITGAFDTVHASSPFFAAALTQVGNGLRLTLTPIAFNAVSGLTRNQQAVADALQNAYAGGTPTGDAATLFSNLFAATSVSVFDQLSGAGTSATQDASFGAAALFDNAMWQQGLAWLSGSGGAGIGMTVGGPLPYAARKRDDDSGHEAFASLRPTSLPGRWRAWGAGFGASRSVDGEASVGSADETTRTAGGAFGVDHEIAADLLVGLAVGGSGSTFSVSSLATSGRVNGAHIGAYAVKSFGASYLAAIANYARFDNATSRSITGVGPTETASGRFDSDQFGGRVELGHRFAHGTYALTPFAAVEPAALKQHAYSETSTTAAGAPGILGLSYASHTARSLPTSLGVQLDGRLTALDGMTLKTFARAAWVHEFEPARKVNASFISVPSASFTVDGARAAENAVRIESGGTLTLSARTAMFSSLTSEFSGRARVYAASAGLTTAW